METTEGRRVNPLNRIVLAGLCFVISAFAQDPGGWQKTKWGITEAQLLKMYPAALKIDAPATATNYGFTVTDVVIEKMHFDIKFWFDETGLRLVALTPDGAEKIIRPAVYYGFMFDLLRDKYGKPASQKESQDDGITGVTKESEWRLNTTVISILYIDPTRFKERTLVVQYRKRYSSDAI
jgi:hypothetical protein